MGDFIGELLPCVDDEPILIDVKHVVHMAGEGGKHGWGSREVEAGRCGAVGGGVDSFR